MELCILLSLSNRNSFPFQPQQTLSSPFLPDWWPFVRPPFSQNVALAKPEKISANVNNASEIFNRPVDPTVPLNNRRVRPKAAPNKDPARRISPQISTASRPRKKLVYWHLFGESRRKIRVFVFRKCAVRSSEDEIDCSGLANAKPHLPSQIRFDRSFKEQNCGNAKRTREKSKPNTRWLQKPILSAFSL